MNQELATFLTAMTPIGELRAAIPLAIGVYKMSPANALFWSISGNIAIAVLLIRFLCPAVKILTRRLPFLKRFLWKVLLKTRKNYYKKHENWGSLALVMFVAIPLPMTGAWTAAIIAFLFGIPFCRALALISAGIIIAGFLVLGVTLGALKIFF
ncbi:MAG: small multi-drug export protein [bacterium]|nr:small multi-drug export protein [bacterium]